MNNLGNLKDKLDEGIICAMDAIQDEKNFNPNAEITEYFPVSIYRIVTINNKNYQLHIELTIK